MNRRLITFLAALYLVVGTVAVAYIAGIAYFLFSKAIPVNIEIDTWLRYWDSYAADPVQRKRLLAAAVAAVALVFGLPLIGVATIVNHGRSLHGDARWATRAEIRKAGLL
jgi:type IV secretion system protein VirD4